MSRAFVKEEDGDDVPEALVERQHSDAPNYITPAGLETLRERATELTERRDALAAEPERLGRKGDLQRVEAELRFQNERIQRAIVVSGAPRPPHDTIGVGARIGLADENDDLLHFTIVGEDEVDVAAGKVSWNSPLGRAVLHSRLGDIVKWRRPGRRPRSSRS